MAEKEEYYREMTSDEREAYEEYVPNARKDAKLRVIPSCRPKPKATEK